MKALIAIKSILITNIESQISPWLQNQTYECEIHLPIPDIDLFMKKKSLLDPLQLLLFTN